MKNRVIEVTTSQEFMVNVKLTESEARALYALVGYGGKGFVESFLPVFYEKMGKHYMKPHEQGLSDLFDNIRTNISSALWEIDQAKKLFNESIQVVKP